MQRVIIGFIALFTIISCGSEQKKKSQLTEEQMIELLVDIHKTDALLTRAVNRGEIKKEEIKHYYKGMLDKHNITRDEFDSAFDYYSHDFKKFDKIYAEVLARIKLQEDTLKHTKKTTD